MKTLHHLRVLRIMLSLLAITLMPYAPSNVAVTHAAELPSSIERQSTMPNFSTDQIIVKYKASANIVGRQAAERLDPMATLNRVAGVNLTYFREMSGEAHVLKLSTLLPEEAVNDIALKLQSLPEIEYAEADGIAQPHLAPNDPQYSNQWHYNGPYGINLPAAWDITTGNNSVVVAVIDTGILANHPDMVGRTLGGYDFITDAGHARDGDGRDSNPADEGNWRAKDDCGVGDPGQASSWHGTHVAGTIGAASNNNVGVAGVNWGVQLLPVRVLGQCGGQESDIADAIRWSAGVAISGVPTNSTPARVLNLSLGGKGSCPATYQTAIDAARKAGAVIVVSAGNDGVNAGDYTPANCTGVITVAATDSAGNRSVWNAAANSASNFGGTVEISAPGSNVLSTSNQGATTQGAHNYLFYNGTSMAAPHVSGVVSLLLTMRPILTPDEVEQILRSNVTFFPAGSTCNTSDCGTGIVNAGDVVGGFYVNQSYTGIELGARTLPFNTISEAYNAGYNGMRLHLKAGSYNQAIVLSKRMTLLAEAGTVVIGR